MNIAIIPARIGSKRISKKNIKKFMGKPVIWYSIKAALKTKIFNKIIVSTDDSQIAELSKKFGAEVPFYRSANLSDDYTDTRSVIADTINKIESSLVFKNVCCIYPANPFVLEEDIIKGFNLLKKKNIKYVFASASYNHSIFRSFKLDKNLSPKMIFPSKFNKRTQDIEETFHDVGQCYWRRKEDWLIKKNIFNNKNSASIIIPKWRAIDIDTLDDWKLAEKMMKVNR